MFPKQKFKVGDLVIGNKNFDGYFSFDVIGWKVTKIRKGNSDWLINIVSPNGEHQYGIYQYRFDLYKPRKKGNYKRYEG